MSQMLADLIAAHKSLCQALASANGQGIVSTPIAGQPAPQATERTFEGNPFLTEDEERRLADTLGLPLEPKANEPSNALMNQVIEQQFAEMFQRHQEAQAKSPAPALPRQARPQVVMPSEFEERPAKALDLREADPEEAPPAPVSRIKPNAILEDFEQYSALTGH